MSLFLHLVRFQTSLHVETIDSLSPSILSVLMKLLVAPSGEHTL